MFQGIMSGIIADEISSFVFVSMDGILMYSRSVEEHWGHLRHAMEHLRAAIPYGRLHKCDLLQARVDHLCFDISAKRTYDSPDKVNRCGGMADPIDCA